MRVLIVYPGHSIATFDVASGYEYALKKLGVKVRAYNYHSSIDFYTEAINYYRSIREGFNPSKSAPVVLASEHVVIEAVEVVPDIIIIVNGMSLHRRAYDLLHRLNIPIALMMTESPYLDDFQAKMVKMGHISLAFTNDRTSVEKINEMTGITTVYLPHSYNTKIHKPMSVPDDYKTDVFFHGTMWPERNRLLSGVESFVREKGWDARITGIEPLKDNRTKEETIRAKKNMMPNSEMAKYIAGTKIAINHNRTISKGFQGGKELHIKDAYSLGPRAYEIAACGAFQLCDGKREELFDIFGDSVATYDGPEDLRDKIEFYLSNNKIREEMAIEARERAKDCSFERRAEEILIPMLESEV